MTRRFFKVTMEATIELHIEADGFGDAHRKALAKYGISRSIPMHGDMEAVVTLGPPRNDHEIVEVEPNHLMLGENEGAGSR